MSHESFCQTVVIGVMTLILGAGSVAVAQESLTPPDEFPRREAVESEIKLSERRLQRIYDSAQIILERGDFGNALPLLQSILDYPQDTLYFPDPQNRDRAVSLKGQVLETLAALPVRAIKQYDLLYRSQAEDLLEQSSQQTELAILEEVARRFYFTSAGQEAAYRLALTYFDRGNYLSAALTFERLLEAGTLSRSKTPAILFQTALSWQQMGLSSEAERLVARLHESVPSGQFKMGGRTVRLAQDSGDALAWLAKTAEIDTTDRGGLDNWRMFRGNAQRTALSEPAPPIREADWNFRTIPLAESDDPRQLELVERELNRISEDLRGSDYLQIPAAHPLLIDDKIVFRSLGNLKAIELGSGELLWETFRVDSAFQNLLAQGQDAFSSREAQVSELERYLMQRSWRDVTSGTLSSDGTRVYAIEDQGFLKGMREYPNRVSGNESKQLNKLVAYDLDSGKELWELSTAGGQYPELLHEAIFLGPPLVQGNELYCLIEADEEVILLALQNREGADGRLEPIVLWSQPLPMPVATEFNRNTPFGQFAGLTPSYANGLLVCPTAQGTVVAFDLARRILSWRYQYSDGVGLTRTTGNELNMIQQAQGVGPEDESRWLDSVPTIVRGRVLLTPCDSSQLHCLNLTDGTLLWTRNRAEDLYLGGIDRESAILIGRREIHAISLETGDEKWSVPIPLPSGRGFQTGRTYTVPLSTAETVTIDLDRGIALAYAPVESGRVPGNLVAAENLVVSQSADRIFRFESLPTIQQQIEQNPSAPSSELLQAELNLYDGKTEYAISQLLELTDSQPSKRVNSILKRLMFAALERDFDASTGYLAPLAELTRGTPDESHFREINAEGLNRSGRSNAAFAEFLKLIDQPKRFLDRPDRRVRNDRWARANLLTLFENGSAEQQALFSDLIQQKLASLESEENPNAVAALQGFPGTDAWTLKQIDKIDPYTQTLELEQALLELQHSPSADLRRWGLARLYKLLMKLEQVEQAAILREQLLSRHADEVCYEGQTGTQLAEWGLENPKLQAYLAARNHIWPQAPVHFASVMPSPVPQQGLQTLVVGDPGLFADWTFEFSQHQSRKLLIFDPFGKLRNEIHLPTRTRNQSEVVNGRELFLHGHLAVLKFADHFVVLNLFERGMAGFLHGPHQLQEPLGGETNRNRSGGVNIEHAVRLNGHPTKEVFDLFHEPMGQIGLVSAKSIVYQQDEWLIAIETLSGELLWKRRVDSHGQFLCGNADIIVAVPRDLNLASFYRTADGEPLGERDLDGLQSLLAATDSRLVFLTQQDELIQIESLNLVTREIEWTLPCEADALFQTVGGDRLALVEKSRRFRLIDLSSGAVRADLPFLAEKKDAPEAEKKADSKAGELLAFWMSELNDGWLLMTQEVPDDDSEVRVSPVYTDFPLVHGDVIKIADSGEMLWRKRVEHQSCPPNQPVASPVWLFLSRHYPDAPRLVRVTNQYVMELVDLRSGESLPLLEGQRPSSPVNLVVEPNRSIVELTGSRDAYVIKFGEDPPPADPKTSPPAPAQ